MFTKRLLGRNQETDRRRWSILEFANGRPRSAREVAAEYGVEQRIAQMDLVWLWKAGALHRERVDKIYRFTSTGQPPQHPTTIDQRDLKLMRSIYNRKAMGRETDGKMLAAFNGEAKPPHVVTKATGKGKNAAHKSIYRLVALGCLERIDGLYRPTGAPLPPMPPFEEWAAEHRKPDETEPEEEPDDSDDDDDTEDDGYIPDEAEYAELRRRLQIEHFEAMRRSPYQPPRDGNVEVARIYRLAHSRRRAC